MARFLAFAIALIAVSILAGCASQAEIAQRQAEQRMAIQGQQELTCLNYGLQPRTPAFADCMLRLAGMQQQQDMLQQQQAFARQQATARSLAQGLANTGNSNPNKAGGALANGMGGALGQ
jgi:hypothetical protein